MGAQNFLLERGDKLVKREVDVEMGGGRLSLLYYFTVQFSHIYCVCVCVCVCVCGGVEGGGWDPFFTFWVFSLLS